MDPSRLTYRMLLKMHPRGFRRQFEEEMLWIFDEVRPHCNSFRILSDCMMSLFKQHFRAEEDVEPVGRGFGLEIGGSSLTLVPLLRATVLVSIVLLFFFTSLGHSTQLTVPSASFPSPRVYRPSCEDFAPSQKTVHKLHARGRRVKFSERTN